MVSPVSGSTPSGMLVGVVTVVVDDPALVVVVGPAEVVVARTVVVVAWSLAGTPRLAAVVDVTSCAVVDVASGAEVEVAPRSVVGVPGRVVVGPVGGAVVVVGGANGFWSAPKVSSTGRKLSSPV